MKNFLIVPLIVIFALSIEGKALAQGQGDEEGKDGAVNPRFAALNKEVAAVCGEFLPNQITGITEMMGLCGGRVGFKISDKTFLEIQVLSGASVAQKYMIGSLGFRGDFQIDDIVISAYGGGDIHNATAPVYTNGMALGQQSNLYFGAHLGGALWWDLTDSLYLRTDIQFLLNPGTSLFAGLSLALRFGGGGEGAAKP